MIENTETVTPILGPTFLKIVFLVVVLLGGGGDKVLGLVADGQMGGTAWTRRARLEHAHEAVRCQILSKAHLSVSLYVF